VMLAGKAADAAAVLRSFKNSRRSVLMLNITSLDYLGGNRVGSLVTADCDRVTIKLRLCNFVAERYFLQKSTARNTTQDCRRPRSASQSSVPACAASWRLIRPAARACFGAVRGPTGTHRGSATLKRSREDAYVN